MRSEGFLPSTVNIRKMPGRAIGQRVVWSLDWVFSREYVEECLRALLIVLRTIVMRKVNWVPHDFLPHKDGVREV